MMLNLKEMIGHFVDHRHEVVVRRSRYDLSEAQKRAHILEGLLIAIDQLDAQSTQLVAHGGVDAAVAAGDAVAGFAGQGGQTAHEGAADT